MRMPKPLTAASGSSSAYPCLEPSTFLLSTVAIARSGRESFFPFKATRSFFIWLKESSTTKVPRERFSQHCTWSTICSVITQPLSSKARTICINTDCWNTLLPTTSLILSSSPIKLWS